MPATFNPATGTLTFVQGKHDTLTGINLQVAGEAFPRVTITPQGSIVTGDGTIAPAKSVSALPAKVTAAAAITPLSTTPTISAVFDNAEVRAAIGVVAAGVNAIIAALGA
jgi:hypothetical protein